MGKYNDIDGILGKSLTLFDERFLGGGGGGISQGQATTELSTG